MDIGAYIIFNQVYNTPYSERIKTTECFLKALSTNNQIDTLTELKIRIYDMIDIYYRFYNDSSKSGEIKSDKLFIKWIDDKISVLKGEKIIPEIVYAEKEFYWWPYSYNKLSTLKKSLLYSNLIEDNNEFENLFKTEVISKDYKTNWISTNSKLIYLSYLIFDCKTLYRNTTIYNIASSLFFVKGKNVSNTSLNKSFNHLKINNFHPKELPKTLIPIKELWDNLPN